MEGTTIYKTPVTLETLLQSFTGRNFLNVTGEAPSLRQMQEDVEGAEVAVESKPDTWRIDDQGELMIKGLSGGLLECMKPYA